MVRKSNGYCGVMGEVMMMMMMMKFFYLSVAVVTVAGAVASVAEIREHFGTETIESSAPGICTVDENEG